MASLVPLLAPLLTVAGFVGYMVAATRFAWMPRTPWLFLAIMASGVALAAWSWWVHPRLATRVSALLASGVLALAVWFLFSFTMLGPREDRPRVGDTFPDFALPTSTGETFRLSAAGDRRHLIILYRGDW